MSHYAGRLCPIPGKRLDRCYVATRPHRREHDKTPPPYGERGEFKPGDDRLSRERSFNSKLSQQRIAAGDLDLAGRRLEVELLDHAVVDQHRIALGADAEAVA